MTVGTLARPGTQTRDRAIDGLRALAILGVVCGHWLVGGLSPGAGGGLAIDSPLRTLPTGWRRRPGSCRCSGVLPRRRLRGREEPGALARERGGTDGAWLRRRFARLAWPMVGAVGVVIAGIRSPRWTASGGDAAHLGGAGRAAVLVHRHLRRDDRAHPGGAAARPRWGWAAALPWWARSRWSTPPVRADGAPEATGYLTVVPAWMFTYQLGVAWARGAASTGPPRGRPAAGGAALFAALLVVGHYPAEHGDRARRRPLQLQPAVAAGAGAGGGAVRAPRSCSANGSAGCCTAGPGCGTAVAAAQPVRDDDLLLAPDGAGRGVPGGREGGPRSPA